MTVPYIGSLAERYAEASEDERRIALALLPIEKQQQLARLDQVKPWWFYGRPDQFEPGGWAWRWWVINGGRGWGKTRTGAETTLARCRRYPGMRAALIAPTFADARDTMVEGESGLLACLDVTELRGSSFDTGWNRSMGELYMANGSRMKVFTSEKPRQLRGPQHHFIWGDEPSYWNDVAMGTAKDSTFSNANIGLRLKALRGWDHEYRPCGVLTMTPRLVPLLKVPDELVAEKPHLAGLLQRKDVALTTGATMANLRNLDRGYFDAVIAPMLNTTLGLQELGGILLEQVEGALWTRAELEAARTDAMPAPGDLAKTVVAFDPAGGEGITHDEHGIIVASSSGTLKDLQLWVREDRSANTSVDTAARRVILAAHEFDVDAIVYEKNQGQDWVGLALRSAYAAMVEAKEVPRGWRLPSLYDVPAIKSKLQRATPIHGFYEQGRVHHVGTFPVLEGQQTTWVPGETDSPDRLDALVWALTWLYGYGPSGAEVASSARRERGGRRANQPSSRLPAVYGARGGRR